MNLIDIPPTEHRTLWQIREDLEIAECNRIALIKEARENRAERMRLERELQFAERKELRRARK